MGPNDRVRVGGPATGTLEVFHPLSHPTPARSVVPCPSLVRICGRIGNRLGAWSGHLGGWEFDCQLDCDLGAAFCRGALGMRHLLLYPTSHSTPSHTPPPSPPRKASLYILFLNILSVI